MSTRSYESGLRTEQARLTRARIVDAARALLLDGGYEAMTMAALARAADVSTQTIYNAVGGKAAVIKAAYDVTLAGDDDPRPMIERPEFSALVTATDPATMLRAYAAFSRRIGERVGPLLAALGANADEEVRAFTSTIEDERLRGNGSMVAQLARRVGLPKGMSRQRATDIVWALTAPELFARLVRQRGWTPAEYERWLGDALIDALVAA